VRADIIVNEEDDELEPGARNDDADEDLDEDDYGIPAAKEAQANLTGDTYFDNGEGEWDEYVDPGNDDD
jgi:hypothetical protein